MRLCSCKGGGVVCMGNREKFESWLGVTDWLNLLTLARGRDHQPQENERTHFWAGPIGALFMVRQLWLIRRHQGQKWLGAGHFRTDTVSDGYGKPDHDSRVLGHRTMTFRAVWQAGLKFWLVIKDQLHNFLFRNNYQPCLPLSRDFSCHRAVPSRALAPPPLR